MFIEYNTEHNFCTFSHADLIVGAPLYTDYSSDAYETGRVQVFYYRPGVRSLKVMKKWESTKLLGG